MAELNPESSRFRRGKTGLTLVEVLCVMAILVLLLSVAVTSSMNWGRGAGRRVSAASVASALDLARQWAIAWNQPVSFNYGNSTDPVELGYYSLGTNGASGQLGAVSHLARGYVFDIPAPTALVFLPDGTCESTGNVTLVVREIRPVNYLSATLVVSRTTAAVRLLE